MGEFLVCVPVILVFGCWVWFTKNTKNKLKNMNNIMKKKIIKFNLIKLKFLRWLLKKIKMLI